MKIEGATIMVTGGGSGLGAACAKRFVANGANVLLADVNEDAGRAMQAELGEATQFQPTDVTDSASVDAALDACEAWRGPLRGVVNCAGILGASRVLTRDGAHDLEVFQRVIHVNLVGTFNVMRLAATRLAQAEPLDENERGVVINTASVAAFEGQVGQVAYSASKGGVASMTLPVARELARIGVRVAAIAPGVFETPMMAAAPDAVRESLVEQSVFPKRLGLPDEYAALAQQIFENRMLNGCVIRLDGGMRMQAK